MGQLTSARSITHTMVVRLAAQDARREESMRNLLRFSPQMRIETSEGMSLNISTSLLTMYSNILSSLLSVHSCVSSTIILPDFTLLTLSNLVELLTKGYSKQCSDDLEVQNLLDIGEALGIDLDSLYLGARGDSNQLCKIKQESQMEEMGKEAVGEADNDEEITNHRAESLGGKVKEIVSKRETDQSDKVAAELSEESSNLESQDDKSRQSNEGKVLQ